jgi:phage host-nuclease inhibitor protein Gam
MARKRIEGTALKSYDDADQVLRKIGELDRKLTGIESAANARIDAAKASAKEQSEPLLAIKSDLERQLKEFCESNRADFVTTRTRVLTFGSIGFRRSVALYMKNAADTLQALKALALTKCVRIIEEIDKEQLRLQPTDILAQVGASVRHKDTFGYDVKAEAIEPADEAVTA